MARTVEIASASMSVAPGAKRRGLTVPDFSKQLARDIAGALSGLAQVDDALGAKPLETLTTADAEALRRMEAQLAEVAARVEEVREMVHLTLAVRLNADSVKQQPKLRNGFKGEAHLDEIHLNAVLRLDSKTGLIKEIKVLGPDEAPEGLERDEINTVITGSELVKETLAKDWTEDQGRMKGLEAAIEQVLKDRGWVVRGDESLRVIKITPLQIPAAKAWVNPEGQLRAKWDTGSRAALARARRRELK